MDISARGDGAPRKTDRVMHPAGPKLVHRDPGEPPRAGALALALVLLTVFLLQWWSCGRAQDSAAWWIESSWSMPECSTVNRWGLRPAAVWIDGEWFRVVTAMFTHGSWLHVSLNAWSLFAVGPWIQAAWGAPRMLLLFLASGVAGCLASLAWAEGALIVGASGGIFGLAGALWWARQWGADPLQRALHGVSSRGLLFSLAFLLLLGAFLPVVAQAGHLGGLLVGLGVGAAWTRRSRLAFFAGVGVMVFVLVGLATAAVAPRWRPNYLILQGYEWLERDRPERAAEVFRELPAAQQERPEVANAWAYALAEAKRELGLAEDLVRRSLAQAPGDADKLDTLGWIRCRRGDAVEGSSALLAALDGEADPVVVEHLVRCPIEAGDVER